MMLNHIYRIIAIILLLGADVYCDDICRNAAADIKSGNYESASDILKKRILADPYDFKALFLLFQVSDIVGDRRAILRYRHFLKNLYSAGKLKSAPGLTAYAQSVQESDPQGALILLNKAHKADPDYVDAYILAGNLCYERYAWSRAGEEFKKALKIEPGNPEAVAGLAVLDLASGDIRGASKKLEKALEKHPDSVELLVPSAYIAMLNRNYEKCLKMLDKAYRINPESIDVNSLYAALYEIRGDVEKRDKYIDKVLKVNSRSVDIYNTLAVAAEQKYRFKDAVKWAERAMLVNPDHWRGYFLAGNNLLHLGEEKKGYKLLEKSFEKNSFNLLAYNILKVVDRDFKAHQVETFETVHFAVKMSKQDAPVLWPYMEPLLEKSYKKFTEQFNIEPVGPEEHNGKILIHILSDHMGFSARTMGLPGISANGVCFGQVVLMPSPRYISLGDTKGMDWKSVFEHEFLHILTLQKSDFKISRWFTEGISTLEESDLHGQWNTFFAMANKSGKLLPVESLESGFISPTYPMQVPVSYYQAAMVCRYFREKLGDKALNDMIDLYRQGKTTEEVLEKVSGQNLDELNKSLKIFYDKQQKAGQEFVSKFAAEITKAEEEYKLDTRVKEKVKPHARRWEKIVKIWREDGKNDRAVELLEKLITFDDSDFKLFKVLSKIYIDQKEWGKASDYLLKAIYRNPFDLEVHKMAEMCYKHLNMPDEQKREGAVIAVLEE